MRTPSSLDLVILALFAFRLTRLVGWDDLTITLRTRILGFTDQEYDEAASVVAHYQERGEDPWAPAAYNRHATFIGSPRRFYLAKLAHCPWCVGFWISLLVWLAYQLEPRVTVEVGVAFALASLVGLVAKNLDP